MLKEQTNNFTNSNIEHHPRFQELLSDDTNDFQTIWQDPIPVVLNLRGTRYPAFMLQCLYLLGSRRTETLLQGQA